MSTTRIITFSISAVASIRHKASITDSVKKPKVMNRSSSRITGTVKTAITMAAMIVNNLGLLSIACCIKVPPYIYILNKITENLSTVTEKMSAYVAELLGKSKIDSITIVPTKNSITLISYILTSTNYL